jgi:hypothetical protein
MQFCFSEIPGKKGGDVGIREDPVKLTVVSFPGPEVERKTEGLFMTFGGKGRKEENG